MAKANSVHDMNVSDDVKALNPELFGPPAISVGVTHTEMRGRAAAQVADDRTEHEIQAAVISKCEELAHIWPEFHLVYANTNAGKRSWQHGKVMKAEGLKAGVPDLFWPVARGGFHGLYIEMKRPKKKPRPNQLQWLGWLSEQGYATAVFTDDIETIAAMRNYFEENGHYEDRNWANGR